MLWAIFLILMMMWALGLGTSYTLGGSVHAIGHRPDFFRGQSHSGPQGLRTLRFCENTP